MRIRMFAACAGIAVGVMVGGLQSLTGSEGPAQTTARAIPRPAPSKIYAADEEIPEPVRLDTLRVVWETLRDKYFDVAMSGIDWAGVRARYHPLVLAARASEAFHALLAKMVHELPASHLAVIPPHQVHQRASSASVPVMVPESVVLRGGEEGVLVYAVREGTPAWTAGLRPGHVVRMIGETTFDPETVRTARRTTLDRARRLLAGPPATAVALHVIDQRDQEQVISVPRTVPRQAGPNMASAVCETRRLRDQIGYISIDNWAFDLADKLRAAFAALDGAPAIIVDLRQNPGGMDPGATALARLLLARSGILSVDHDRTGKRSELAYEGGGEAVYRGRVAILLDERSASMSEVVAAALQEAGRAVVVGRVSYGGVINSTQVILPTEGVLQYPHSEMRTPKGTRLEGRGVIPDVPVDLKRADLAAGRDTVIEKAVDVLLAK